MSTDSVMRPLNYCREMVYDMRLSLAKASISKTNTPELDATFGPLSRRCCALARRAQKFTLPENGIISDDIELRALDSSPPLRLPFPVIALEFQCSQSVDIAQTTVELINLGVMPKVIIFAEEEDNCIRIQPAFWNLTLKCWIPLGSVALPTTGCLVRKGRHIVNVLAVFEPFKVLKMDPDMYKRVMESIYYRVLNFLNALQCSNIHILETPPKATFVHQNKKNTLPFDSYHILVIESKIDKTGLNINRGGSHASPREHLRRGHVRRLQDGRHIWVNACVVNPGTKGKVIKDYTL